MGQTVYADLYFMINFSMDFLCFYLVAQILSLKLSVARTLIASALGGVYAVAALFLSVDRVSALLIDIAVCVLLCIIAFARKKEWRATLSYIPVYIAISMALGGFMTALFNLFDRMDLPKPPSDSDGRSVWLFALIAIVGGACVMLGGRFFARKTARKNADVTIMYKGKILRLRALCDSGNLLRDPISGHPCIVVDRTLLKGIIPADVLVLSEKNAAFCIDSLQKESIKRIRLIPAQTATGEGMLVAFRTDSVSVDSGKGTHEVDALIVASAIGNTADGSHALIPPELLI